MYNVVYNCRAVQPFAEQLDIEVPVNSESGTRNTNTSQFTATNTSVFNIGWKPLHPSWLEVYIDGFRVINQSTDFGVTNDKYEINETIVTFYEPVNGVVTFISDRNICPAHVESQIVNIENSQGSIVYSAPLVSSVYASLFCEPYVLLQPYHGYVRMTDDRKSLLYVPETGYQGGDAFSYSILTSRGQLSEPKCVNIYVGERPEPEEEEETP